MVKNVGNQRHFSHNQFANITKITNITKIKKSQKSQKSRDKIDERNIYLPLKLCLFNLFSRNLKTTVAPNDATPYLYYSSAMEWTEFRLSRNIAKACHKRWFQTHIFGMRICLQTPRRSFTFSIDFDDLTRNFDNILVFAFSIWANWRYYCLCYIFFSYEKSHNNCKTWQI